MGIDVTPHLSARLVVDRAHAQRIGARLARLGIGHIFVIGGDVKQPAGPFPSAASLLNFFAEGGFTFDQVGVASYPEGHPTVDDATLWHELRLKQRWATYTVTQLCFEAGAIATWLKNARAHDVTLPVHVGVAGVVERAKLIRLALRIGVGDSSRFVSKNRNLMAGLLGRRAYSPGPLIAELSRWTGANDIAGYHFYTFNQVEATEEWRRRALEAAP